MLINRAVKPKPKEKVDFTTPKINYGNVENIEYYHIEKNNFPIINLISLLDFGYRLDKPGKRGLTYLASKMLSKGAGKYNSLELNERFQYLGLNVSSGITEDNFSSFMQSLTENFEEAFSLIADIIYRPHLKEVDFIPEKKNLISVLQHAKTDPNTILYFASNKVFGHATSIQEPYFGYIEEVENITIDDIRTYYNEIIKNSKLTLFFTGNITTDEIERLIKKYLQPRNTFLLKPETFFNKQPLVKNLYYVDLSGKPQTLIGLAQKLDHYKKIDKFSLEIAINILGGSFTSRLNSNLREDKGFTYGISSYLNYHIDIGFVKISTSVDAENSVNAVKEIYKEIDKLCEGITEEEVNFAKENIINTFPMSFVTYHSINSHLKNSIVLGNPLNYWENYRDEIRNRSIEQITDVIRKTFNTKTIATVLVGDRSKFEISENGFFCKINKLDINGNII